MTRYKQALLDHLVTQVQQSPAPQPVRARRRKARWLVAATAAVVATALGLLIAPLVATPAYAVTKHGDGTVSITFRDLADPVAATRDLNAAGVPARVVRLSQPGSCPAPTGSGQPWQRPLPAPNEVQIFDSGAGGQFDDAVGYVKEVSSNGVTFVPAEIPAGATVFLAERADHKALSVGFGLVAAPAPACWEVDPAIA